MFILLAVWSSGKTVGEKKQVNTRPKNKGRSRLMLASVSRLQIPFHRRLFEVFFLVANLCKSKLLLSFQRSLVFKNCKLPFHRQRNLFLVCEENLNTEILF